MAMNNNNYEVNTQLEFSQARNWTLLQRISSLFGIRCNDLLPAGSVINQLNPEDASELGIRSVPLKKIVGSSGRYRDFDLSYRPLRDGMMERWVRIAKLSNENGHLPPVKLYKIGQVYFVEDGNHRISVARSRNQRIIEAKVIELDPSPLTPNPECKRLRYKV